MSIFSIVCETYILGPGHDDMEVSSISLVRYGTDSLYRLRHQTLRLL